MQIDAERKKRGEKKEEVEQKQGKKGAEADLWSGGPHVILFLFCF
jgi:hypothetical protein